MNFKHEKFQNPVFSENWISNVKNSTFNFLVEIEFQTWKIQNPVFSENWVSNVKNSNSVFSENWWEKVCNVYHFTFKIHTIGPMIEEEISTFLIGSHFLF